MTTPKRAALYLRVSTDGQSTVNQLLALEASAAQRGWSVVSTYDDAGISGAKGRDKRPGLDAMLKDAVRGKFDVIMVWHVDRLGRSLADLVGTLQELDGAKVDMFIHQQSLDTTTPGGRAMFGMLAVFAEFERGMIQSRIKAGQARVRDAMVAGKKTYHEDGRLKKPIGGRSLDVETTAKVHAALVERNASLNKMRMADLAEECGISERMAWKIQSRMNVVA